MSMHKMFGIEAVVLSVIVVSVVTHPMALEMAIAMPISD